MRIIIIVIFFICLTSCKLVSVSEASINLSSSHSPGDIGLLKESIGSYEFKEAGSSLLEEEIKLSLNKVAFSKRELRQYNKKFAKESQLHIVDSLKLHPDYFILEISDKIEMLEALNSASNKNILAYLQSTGNNSMVTSMKIYFPEEVASQLSNATAVYLVNSSPGSYALELINKDNSRKLIHFNEGVAFGYGFSDFCWKENYRGEAVVAALRQHGKSCPGITKKDPETVQKKDIFEKF